MSNLRTKFINEFHDYLATEIKSSPTCSNYLEPERVAEIVDHRANWLFEKISEFILERADDFAEEMSINTYGDRTIDIGVVDLEFANFIANIMKELKETKC